MKRLIISLATLFAVTAFAEVSPPEPKSDGFVPLFNGKNWDGWHLKIRSGDEEMAKKVYAIEDGVVHVFNEQFPQEIDLNTGKNDTHGLFYTNKKYSRYIFRFEYKWGTRIANNFGEWQYDAGCYYHVTDDRVWPVGIEYQVRYDHTKKRNNTGDLIRPKGAGYQWISNAEGTEFLLPEEGGKAHKGKGWMHAAAPTENYHALNDQWNRCEIIVMGDQYAIHKLNGDIVNIAVDLSHSEGIIGLQSETAEIFYRNIQIKEFKEAIPMEHFLKK